MYRHIIVFWVDENSYSVSTDNFVITKACLDDPELVGLVEYGDLKKRAPKDGWKAFNARVLAVSDDLNEIIEKEGELKGGTTSGRPTKGSTVKGGTATGMPTKGGTAIGGTATGMPTKGGTAKESAAKESSSTGSTTIDLQAKGCGQKRKITEHFNASLLKDADNIQHYTILILNKDEEIKKLKAEVQELKSDNADLKVLRRLNLEHQENLQKMTRKIRVMEHNQNANTVQNTRPVAPTPSPTIHNSAETVRRPIAIQSIASAAVGSSSIVETDLPIQKYLISPVANQGDWRKTTCNVMIATFTAAELQLCSVTGRQTKASTAVRAPLDAQKVNAVVDQVQRLHPGVERRQIVEKMAQKLKDDRTRAAKVAIESVVMAPADD